MNPFYGKYLKKVIVLFYKKGGIVLMKASLTPTGVCVYFLGSVKCTRDLGVGGVYGERNWGVDLARHMSKIF